MKEDGNNRFRSSMKCLHGKYRKTADLLARITGSKVINKKAKYLLCKKFWYFTKTSRFSGLLPSVLYGLLLFYYVGYMILEDANNDVQPIKFSMKANLTRKFECSLSKTNKMDTVKDKISANFIIPNLTTRTKRQQTNNSTKQNITPPYDKSSKNRKIGALTGASCAIFLGVTSVFSRYTRCVISLLFPAMFTGRGRAFLITLTMGILVEGPINSINYNFNEVVVESPTCMYESTKLMACRYTLQLQKMFANVDTIISKTQLLLNQRLYKIQKQVRHLTKGAQEKLKLRERQLRKLKYEFLQLRKAFQKATTPCEYVKSTLSGTGDWFKKIGRKMEEIFSKKKKKRRRRNTFDICGVSIPFPDADINTDIASEALKDIKKWSNDMIPNFNMLNLSWPDVMKLLRASDFKEIRYKILDTISNLFNTFHKGLTNLKKFFLIISLLVLTIDTVRYVRLYYVDDNFDNKFMDDNIRRLWKYDTFEKLEPLRNWELNENYQVSYSPKLTKKELKTICLKAFPILCFSIFAIALLFGDYALINLLQVLATHGKYTVSFDGIEAGINLSSLFQHAHQGNNTLHSLNLETFELSTDSCLPRAHVTRREQLAGIIVLIIIIILSCIFDAYTSRMRAIICNGFYPIRAEERGKALHNLITSGRNHRYYKLKTEVLEDKKRRRRLKDFSWWFSALTFLQWIVKQKAGLTVECSGCKLYVKLSLTKEISFMEGSDETKCRICEDCQKDVKLEQRRKNSTDPVMYF